MFFNWGELGLHMGEVRSASWRGKMGTKGGGGAFLKKFSSVCLLEIVE